MAITPKIVADIRVTESSALDLASRVAEHALSAALSWTDGTGAGQADTVWSDKRTLGDGANENLDLSGALSTAFGTTMALTAVKAIMIKAAAANTTNLTVTAPAVNGVAGLFAALDDGIVIKPGGVFLWADPSAAGVTVTAATADLLNVANGAGAAATYDVIVLGES